jgi:hypothetical protein
MINTSDSTLSIFVTRTIALIFGLMFTIMGGLIAYFTYGSYDKMSDMEQHYFELREDSYANLRNQDTLKTIYAERVIYSAKLLDSIKINIDSIYTHRKDIDENKREISKVKRTIGLF